MTAEAGSAAAVRAPFAVIAPSMGRYLGLLLVLAAGCASPVPGAESGVSITIRNEDDQAAELEVTLYNASTGLEETTMEPIGLSPGDTMTIHVEATRGRDDAYHVIVNNYVAVSSDFLGCGNDMEPPLPEELLIIVLPNGQPDACSNWPVSR